MLQIELQNYRKIIMISVQKQQFFSNFIKKLYKSTKIKLDHCFKNEQSHNHILHNIKS